MFFICSCKRRGTRKTGENHQQRFGAAWRRKSSLSQTFGSFVFRPLASMIWQNSLLWRQRDPVPDDFCLPESLKPNPVPCPAPELFRWFYLCWFTVVDSIASESVLCWMMIIIMTIEWPTGSTDAARWEIWLCFPSNSSNTEYGMLAVLSNDPGFLCAVIIVNILKIKKPLACLCINPRDMSRRSMPPGPAPFGSHAPAETSGWREVLTLRAQAPRKLLQLWRLQCWCCNCFRANHSAEILPNQTFLLLFLYFNV